MDSKFPLLKPTRKTGGERFRSGQAEMDFTLLDFWQWAASDLVSNTGRGHLAEFIVARALGLGIGDVRREWDPYDLLMNEIKIEVKSAAYVQSWFQKKLSVISFNVPARRGYDPETNTVEPEPKRHADVYVFALLGHQDKATINPLDITQWVFYVLPTYVLNQRKRSQVSITLKSLVSLCGLPTSFASLRSAVERAAPRLLGKL